MCDQEIDFNIRDFYAGLAMHALIKVYATDPLSNKSVAQLSFELADKMLAQRNKERDDDK